MPGRNASPADARAGYTIFREAGGEISLEDLNRQLFDTGYGPVSQRMMGHYRNLANAHYDRYISINRFDVARAASRYEDLGSSPRYRYSPIGEGVRLLIAKGNKLWTAAAQVTQLGESGAIMRLVDLEYQAGLDAIKVRPADFVSMRFLESGRTADGRIIEVDPTAVPPLLEVQFTSLVSLADFALGEPMRSAEISLRLRSVDDESSATADQLGRRLFLLFEVVEELRYLANFVNQAAVVGPGYSPPALVQRLNVASPAETILAVSELVKAMFPAGVITAAVLAAIKIPEMRKTWFEGTGIALDNDAKRAAEEDKQLQRERDAAVCDLAKLIRDRALVNTEVSDDFAAELEDLAYTRLGPLLESMADAGVTAIEEIDRAPDVDH